MQLATLQNPEFHLRLSRWLSIALVLILLWLLIRSVALLISGPALPAPVLPELTRSAQTITTVDSNWQLFGRAEAIDYGLIETVQPTPLRLVLRGVVAGEGGYAIIMDEDGNEGVYRVDDVITGNARVEQIENRRVLMIRNGQREALELPGANRVAATTSSGVAHSTNARTGTGLPGGISIASLSGMADQLTLDPAMLAQQITMLPVAGGGFRVRAGRDALIFEQLGFQLNDIVLAINGQPVNNSSDVQAIFTNFQAGQPIAITIRRGERQMVLTPDLNQMLGDF